MADWSQASAVQRRRIAETWLAAFAEALAQRDDGRICAMMHADGFWRDLMTFDWRFTTLHGRDAIGAWLRETDNSSGAFHFRVEAEPTLGAIGEHREVLEVFFTFETALAHGRGFVRLIEDAAAPAGAAAFTLLTSMRELKAFPEALGRKRPRQDLRETARELDNWLDRRNADRAFNDRDPDVVIIGAGMAGLMLAARLRQLDVRTLVVDKNRRVGDVWRMRYRSLTLHNETCMNHFAYMPFPDNWPVFIPKDKLAGWLEHYAEAMELNVWTSTVFLGGEFDQADKRWTVRLRCADGSTRTMRPAHVVLAVGVSGIPNVPRFPGMDAFQGEVVHSSGYDEARDVAGKAALVVGAGTSAHDIAQSLYLRGAQVTMLQRSPITVVSLEPSSVRAYELYRQNEGVRPIEDTDLMIAAVPYELLARLHRPLSKSMAEDDKELLDGLRKVGFLLDNGEDDTGYFLKLLRYQAGYYLNVGASDLIVEGKIGLKAGLGIARLTQKQVVFTDGSAIDADMVVLATGYQPLQEAVRALFGDAIADRLGPIWGIGDDGELRNMYAPTAQEGLYVVGGGFPAARAYSPFTAMIIKASLSGLISPRAASRTAAASPVRRGETARLEHAGEM